LCVLVCSALAATSGCSWIGSSPAGDDPADLRNGEKASPDKVAAALAASREEMRLAPEEPYWVFRTGELYAAVDSTEQAVVHLRSALDLDHDYAPAVALLSKLYYQAEHFEQAVVVLEDYLSRNPQGPDALRAALALHLEALGDVDRAQAVLDECAADSREARATRTFVTLRGDELQSVMETAERALDDDPRSAANHNNYGIALLYAGRPIEARQAFLAALELNETLPGALYNMAIVEAFYFFDEEAGRRWFNRYKQYASEDPDDLNSLLGTDVSALSKPEVTK